MTEKSCFIRLVRVRLQTERGKNERSSAYGDGVGELDAVRRVTLDNASDYRANGLLTITLTLTLTLIP